MGTQFFVQLHHDGTLHTGRNYPASRPFGRKHCTSNLEVYRRCGKEPKDLKFKLHV